MPRPQSLHFKGHIALWLPRALRGSQSAAPATNGICASMFAKRYKLQQNLHFQVHKALRLPPEPLDRKNERSACVRPLHTYGSALTCRFTRGCACHESSTLRFAKRCACHEICTSRFENRPRSPHVQRSRFTGPAAGSKRAENRHHVENAAPARVEVYFLRLP